ADSLCFTVIQTAGAPDRTEVEAFVEFSAGTQGGAGKVPSGAEDACTLARGDILGARQVFLNQWSKTWVIECRSGWGCQQVVGAHVLDDVVHAGHPDRHHRAQ